MHVFLIAVVLSVSPLLGALWNLEIQTIIQSLVLITFLSWISFSLYRGRLFSFLFDSKSKHVVFVFGLSSISLLLSPIKNLITGEWLNLFCGLAILVLSRGISEKQEKKILKLLEISACIICGIAFYQILFIGAWPPSSTLINSNSLAFFSLMIIPLAVSVKNYLLAGIMFLVLILSSSLGGIAAFVFAAGIYLAETYGIKSKKFIVSSGIIAALLAVYFIFGMDFKSVSDRLIWWRDGFKIFMDRMFLGFGYGSFSFIYPAYHAPTAGGLSSIYTHNYFLEFLTENGIFAFAIWFVFLFRTAIKGRPILKYSIIAALAHSFMDFGLSLPFNFWLFCFVVGINNKADKTDEYKKIPYGGFYIVIILALFASGLNYGCERLRLKGLYKSIILFSQKDFKTTEKLFDRAIAIDGGNSLVYNLKGNLCYHSAREKKDEAMPGVVSRTMSIKTAKFLFFEAAAAFEEALIFNPYDKSSYDRLLEIYEYSGEKKLVDDIILRRDKIFKWRKK